MKLFTLFSACFVAFSLSAPNQRIFSDETQHLSSPFYTDAVSSESIQIGNSTYGSATTFSSYQDLASGIARHKSTTFLVETPIQFGTFESLLKNNNKSAPVPFGPTYSDVYIMNNDGQYNFYNQTNVQCFFAKRYPTGIQLDFEFVSVNFMGDNLVKVYNFKFIDPSPLVSLIAPKINDDFASSNIEGANEFRIIAVDAFDNTWKATLEVISTDTLVISIYTEFSNFRYLTIDDVLKAVQVPRELEALC